MNDLMYSEFNFSPEQNNYSCSNIFNNDNNFNDNNFNNNNFDNNNFNNNNFNNNNNNNIEIIDKILLDSQSRNYIIKKIINNNLLFSILYKLFNFDIELLTTLFLGMLIILIFKIISN